MTKRLGFGSVKSILFFSLPNVRSRDVPRLVVGFNDCLVTSKVYCLHIFRTGLTEPDRPMQHLSGDLSILVLLVILPESLLVVNVELIFDFSDGDAVNVFVTFKRALSSIPLFFGDNLHVILSLKYFTRCLSTSPEADVDGRKQVSCRLVLDGDLSGLIFIVDIKRNVELFLEDLRLGGDGGFGLGLNVFVADGAVFL